MHRSVKPQILSVFGDIALAVGTEFKKYMDVTLNTLQQASQAQIDKVDHCTNLMLNSRILSTLWTWCDQDDVKVGTYTKKWGLFRLDSI